jgi:hypothetical protein
MTMKSRTFRLLLVLLSAIACIAFVMPAVGAHAGDKQWSKSCCSSEVVSSCCEMTCCNSPPSEPPVSPVDRQNSSGGNRSLGKLAFDVAFDRAEDDPYYLGGHCAVLPVVRNSSLVMQHVRLQI